MNDTIFLGGSLLMIVGVWSWYWLRVKARAKKYDLMESDKAARPKKPTMIPGRRVGKLLNLFNAQRFCDVCHGVLWPSGGFRRLCAQCRKANGFYKRDRKQRWRALRQAGAVPASRAEPKAQESAASSILGPLA